MTPRPQLFRQGVRLCGSAVLSMATWSAWLALTFLLVVQLWVLLSQELAVPGFILRRIERDIAESGIQIAFGKTSFDPSGRVLLENVRLSLPEFPDTVVHARAVYLQFKPWALASGRNLPDEIRVSAMSAAVPAMLSPSGQRDEIIRDLEATLRPSGEKLELVQLSARFAGILVSARGAVALPPRQPTRPPGSLAEFVSRGFPQLCRRLNSVKEQLRALEEPVLDLELVPSDTRTALVNVRLTAQALNLENPITAHIGELRIVTRLPLFGELPKTSRLDLFAEELRLPQAASARGFQAVLLGRFLPGGYQFEPRELQVAAHSAEAAGYSAAAVSALLRPQPLPRLEADLVAQVMGAPLAVNATADFSQRSAVLRFAGLISPEILTPLSAQLGLNVRKYFDFTSLQCPAGEVRLGAGWRFEQLAAHVAVQGVNAYQVPIDEGRAHVFLTPGRVDAPAAYARIGENFAYGSYAQDLKTREFRFLLNGRLRPLDISGWFGPWWPDFFRQFEFPAVPPSASVEVAGIWREGRKTGVFVSADSAKPVIRGATFDRVRTELFIRPNWIEGFFVRAERPEGQARGTFTYTGHPETNAWRSLDLDLRSTVDPTVAGKIIGPVAEPILSLFKFSQAPEVKAKVHIDRPGSPGGAHENYEVQAVAPGEFRFQNFPVQDASFELTARDDNIVIENFLARFAGGAVSGRARTWGRDDARRLGFDVTLKDASLGQVAAALQNYSAEQKKLPPPPPGKFVEEKANVRLDLSLSAEGSYANLFSYTGGGSAVLRGEGIGEVPLLGLLSSLLRFTTLRFTSANANFKVHQSKVTFSDVILRGANSAIDARGDYLLDRKELDFKAKIFPFQESDGLLKTVVGVVLTPVSNVFEVKLTGSLEKPNWSFVMGPTNFLRSLVPGGGESTATAPTAEPGTGKPDSNSPVAPIPAPATASDAAKQPESTAPTPKP